MIGIYKIVSPTGKVYIGQAVCIKKRKKSYQKARCKGQPRLYASLIKYGFSEHIFEVVEECSEDQLNVRERHWQDFYDVLSEKGLNCKLTKTEDRTGCYSQESKNKNSESLKAFWKTPEGQECRKRQVANTDYRARTTNTDLITKAANTDYKAIVANRDEDARLKNTDLVAAAKKRWVTIIQCAKNGTIIREWLSQKEASQTLKIDHTNISNCLKGRQSTAGGFSWKYKNK